MSDRVYLEGSSSVYEAGQVIRASASEIKDAAGSMTELLQPIRELTSALQECNALIRALTATREVRL